MVTGVASDGTETTETRTVPQGVQLTATGARLVVGGQVIGGDVTITSEPVTGGRRVRIAVEHLTLRLGPDATPIVDVTASRQLARRLRGQPHRDGRDASPARWASSTSRTSR